MSAIFTTTSVVISKTLEKGENIMKPVIPRLSEAQFEIMDVLWEKKEATVSDVLDSINASRKETLQRTTILVQLNRLEEKGWINHRQEGKAFFYYPCREREEAVAEITENFKERIFGGSVADLVKCLFNSKNISKHEIAELRKLLDRKGEK
jgi:BlaI family transcriptional regulator, penicillinase repressor